MKIGAVSLGWSGTSLPVVFKTISSMGGECVDINSNAHRHHGIALNHETAEQILHWASNNGLVIGSLTGYNDFAQLEPVDLDNQIEKLLATCKIAQTMHVPIVRAFVGDLKPEIAFPSVRPNIIKAFQTTCQEAAKMGVRIGIENHGRLMNDGQQLALLIADVHEPNLGITLDTGNFAWAGHNTTQVRNDFLAVLPYVYCVHIKDGIWVDDGFEFVPAGEGDLSLYWLLRRLHAQGFDGPVYSEFEGKGDFETGTAVSIKYLKTIYSQIRLSQEEGDYGETDH